MKFKVGDKVRATKKFNGSSYEGKIGTVISLAGYLGWDIAVEFDETVICGHTCNGIGKDDHCRWGYSKGLELVHVQQIVITTDGKKTTAKLYEGEKVVKTASARCNPEDTFDFNEGAKIAFERLMGKDKAKPESKYKVGQRYVVSPLICNNGIIEITEVGDIWTSWKSVYGMDSLSWKQFEIGSIFEQGLKPFEFKIGDRVKVISKSFGGKNLEGYTGRIIDVSSNAGVEFDKYINGHDCFGKGKNNYCWYGNISDLIPTTEKSESKYKPGDKVKVIANSCWHSSKVGSVLTLKNRDCYFDKEGNLAWRVEETSTYIRESDFEPYVELYNGKVVCVDHCGCNKGTYTVGKVYQFKDGKITTDTGNTLPDYPCHNFGDWSKFTNSKFIEIKE